MDPIKNLTSNNLLLGSEVYQAGGGEPFDIILLTHGKLDLTIECVASIYAHTRSLFHLIVVDDSNPEMDEGTDKTPEWFKRLQVDQQNVTFVHSDIPYKSGNQCFNIGLSHGNHRFVAVVMNSVLVEPDWDIVPIQMLANGPKIGVIGTKCLKLGWGDNSDGRVESAGVYMHEYAPCDMGRDELSHRLLGSYPCASVQWACAFLRREAVVGNLDENIWQGFSGWDDIDNSFYVRYKGWEVWYCGGSICFHRTHATRGSDKIEVLRKNRINGEIFFKRWGYWEKFRKKNFYAPEYYPDNKVKFLCNGDDLPLEITQKPSDIPASMPAEEVKALASLVANIAKPDAVFVEVGSWGGHSASYIANTVKALGGHLYCIDHWKGNEGTSLHQTAEEYDVYKMFETGLKDAGLWEYITPMKMDSLTASKEFEDKSVDLVFLDADHRYDQFMDDLKAWYPKIKDGGIICGHDCENYYSKSSSELKELLDTHIKDDFTGVYHAGVMKALFDYFSDAYIIIKNTRLWVKTKND